MLKTIYRIGHPMVRALSRLRAGLTLGVRVAAFDADHRVALVRHTYLPGWHLPGGGVDRGEAAVDAARRELREETGADYAGPMRLIALYANFGDFPDNHVALFRADGVAPAVHRPDGEIAEIMWARLDDLPAELTASTAGRLAELAGEAPIPIRW